MGNNNNFINLCAEGKPHPHAVLESFPRNATVAATAAHHVDQGPGCDPTPSDHSDRERERKREIPTDLARSGELALLLAKRASGNGDQVAATATVY